jgi:hypothetical protein
MIRTILALVLTLAALQAAAQVRVLQSEGFAVDLQSQLQPVPLNQMHSWVITLRTPEGVPMEGASIQVQGGMPAHDHGLATSPEVTAYLGGGRYLLEGVRFHMAGEWLLQLQIEHQSRQYSATVALSL